MLVKMRSNLYLNDTRYRANPLGTEIPDTVGGKQVVEWKPKDQREEGFYYLPRDVVIIGEADTAAAGSGHLGKEPVTLSELNKKPPAKGEPKTLSEMNKADPDPLGSKKLK